MRKYLLATICSCIITNIYSLETFYYSNSKKNILNIDTNSINILLYPNIRSNEIVDLFRNVTSQNLATENELNLFEITNSSDIRQELKDLKSSKSVAYAWYKTLDSKNKIFIPTGEILLKLNKNNTLD